MLTNHVWVGGLAAESTVDEIRRALSEYGSITGLNEATGDGGFRFVFCKFESYEAAARAIADNGRTLDGARVVIRPAHARRDVQVFVYNIDYNMADPEQALLALLQQYGEVTYLCALDGEGRPRAYAFATYSTPAEATSCLHALPGQVLAGRALGVRRPATKRGPDDRFAASGRSATPGVAS